MDETDIPVTLTPGKPMTPGKSMTPGLEVCGILMTTYYNNILKAKHN